jgi:predicted RNase H-like HicB family nuclease
MKQTFTARVWKEGKWFIAQCAQVDVASHGRTQKAALANLREALELYFEPPTATIIPKIANIDEKTGQVQFMSTPANWTCPVFSL